MEKIKNLISGNIRNRSFSETIKILKEEENEFKFISIFYMVVPLLYAMLPYMFNNELYDITIYFIAPYLMGVSLMYYIVFIMSVSVKEKRYLSVPPTIVLLLSVFGFHLSAFS